MKGKRIEWIDVSKGIAIILMMIGIMFHMEVK